MKFSMLILTIGIPGSGKSTWVKQYKQAHPLVHVISTDEIRKELFGTIVCDPHQSRQVYDEARRRVREIIENPSKEDLLGLGPEIIVDSTNVDIEEWRRYKETKPSIFIAKVFNVDPDEAWKREQQRKYIVPFFVLGKKWLHFQMNKKHLPHIFNMVIE